MDLKATLSEVETFCGVLTLRELLAKICPSLILDREEQEIISFLETTLCLVDRDIVTHESKKKRVTLEEFFKCIEPLIGTMKLHINDFIEGRMSDFPSTHIQKKDIASNLQLLKTTRQRPSSFVASTSSMTIWSGYFRKSEMKPSISSFLTRYF